MAIIDFHSHVLHKIDDGSKSIDMSHQMLLDSKKQNVSIQVATPHFYADSMNTESFFADRSRYYTIIKEEADNIGIDLRLGAEVAYFQGMSEWEDLGKFAISGTNMILIEMPFKSWGDEELDEIEDIIHKGYHPIIAHLERFISYQKDKLIINDLADMRVTVQLNCEYLMRFFRKNKVLNLIREYDNVVLGSDCHNTTTRPQNISEGREIIKEKLGEQTLRRIDNYGMSLLVKRSRM